MIDKIAIITGAANGIGLALTKLCIKEKMHVVMVDVDKNTLENHAADLKKQYPNEILSFACDVSKSQQVEKLASTVIARFNRIDLLINCAGILGHMAPLWELNVEHIRHVMDINLYGTLHCIQAFLPFTFTQSHRTHIVNIASFYGLCSGSQLAAYGMSKSAMVSMTESLYFDLKRLHKPVDLSLVCPTLINTKLISNSAQFNQNIIYQRVDSLMQRSRTPDEVADYIMKEVKNKKFYILPDVEVKNYCEERLQAILHNKYPSEHSLEKIFNAFCVSE